MPLSLYNARSDREKAYDYKQLLETIINQSVRMPKVGKFNLTTVVQWCKVECGAVRKIHPIYQIEIPTLRNNGNRGNWAYTINDDDHVTFWFKKYEHQYLFKITWANGKF
jgi:hypothetical protein